MSALPTTDLLTAARAGDASAFGALVEPHRRDLHAHCYRMLGSLQDAEDALQDALLRAWRGLERFEGRARCARGCTGSPPTPAWTWPSGARRACCRSTTGRRPTPTTGPARR